MPARSYPRVLVAIVNYRTPAMTIDCLKSLLPERRLVPGLEVVVTDNQSPDDSVRQLSEYIGQSGQADWIELKPLPRNGGFAYGNNEAIRERLASDDPPDFVLLLNPDTYIRPRAIRELVDFLQRNPNVGIVGSRCEDPDGTAQRSAFRFPTVASELDDTLRLGLVSRLLHRYVIAPPPPSAEVAMDWVSGASMLIRREVFDAIGLLDAEYFMYFEEVDFCRRARRAGWTCWYAPQSRIVHLVGQASGVTNQRAERKRRPTYWFESRRRYFVKNHGRPYLLACDLATLVGLSLWQVRRVLERKKDFDPPKFLWDSLRHSVFVKGFPA